MININNNQYRVTFAKLSGKHPLEGNKERYKRGERGIIEREIKNSKNRSGKEGTGMQEWQEREKWELHEDMTRSKL